MTRRRGRRDKEGHPRPARQGTGNGILHGAAGFSLLELMVCCTLIGILSMVLVQSLQGFLPAARVNRAVREVAALLEWSRWSAVRHGCRYKVVLSPEEQAISVFRVTEHGPGETEFVPEKTLDLRKDHPGVVFGTAHGVVRTSGCNPVNPSGIHLLGHSLHFLPSGTSDRCGSLYLIPAQDVPDRRDRMRAVSILLSTGRLQMWRYDPFKTSACSDDGGWEPM